VARGWESKAVESQMEDAAETSGGGRVQLTPEQQQKVRVRQGLQLSRARIVQQLEASEDPRYKELMQKTLNDIDRQIAALGS
jgi:hypothetical protein